MKGIYIKGMEMPKDEYSYTEIQIWGDGRVYTRKGVKLIWDYSAIEVPGHGDLIDRDAIVDSVCEGVCSCSECSFNKHPHNTCLLEENLEKLKAVIPAERSEE